MPRKEPEVRGVTLAEAQQGVKLVTGHAVVLVVAGLRGTRRGSAPDTARDPAPGLRTRWGRSGARHGAGVEMIAELEGHEGEEMVFAVERLEQGTWRPFAEARAKVDGGAARATATALHPGGKSAAPPRSMLRFSARPA